MSERLLEAERVGKTARGSDGQRRAGAVGVGVFPLGHVDEPAADAVQQGQDVIRGGGEGRAQLGVGEARRPAKGR